MTRNLDGVPLRSLTHKNAYPLLRHNAQREKHPAAGTRLTRQTLRTYGVAVGLTLGLVILGTGLLIVVVLSTSPVPEVTVAEPPPTEAPLASVGTVVIEWSENERAASAVFVDREKEPVPSFGPVEIELPPGTHVVEMVRRGFHPVEQTVRVAADERICLRPQWVPLVPVPEPPRYRPERVATLANDAVRAETAFDDWLQDFEAAKRKAAAEDKDVLLLFDGSDWCGWSKRLTAEVFAQPSFDELIGEKYVPVFVDFPRSSAARASVEDPSRNARLKNDFQVDGYPTVVLTDAVGAPLGRIGGYVPGGVDAFVARLESCREVKRQSGELRRRIERSREPAEKAATVRAPERFREDQNLLPFDDCQQGGGEHGR